jgi:hypothetical protein
MAFAIRSAVDDAAHDLVRERAAFDAHACDVGGRP